MNTRTTSKLSVPLAALVCTLVSQTIGAEIPTGVPEPGLVIWGAVVNQTNTTEALQIESAEWSVTDGVKTAMFDSSTRPAVRIFEKNNEFFYVMEVPFDTRRMGNVTLEDPATVGLDSFELKSSTPPTYVLTPTINGVLANLHKVNGAPSGGASLPVPGFSSFTRGRVIRVDLSIIPPTQSYESWAAENFGDPNAPQAQPGFDADGDGMSNEKEYMAGTDPNDPDSALRVLTLSFNEDHTRATMEWKSVTDKQYVIEFAADVTGPWTELGTPVDGSESVTSTSFDLLTEDPNYFYRVRLAE